MDDVLATGYLSDAEAVFRAGAIEDYHLFPAGRLRSGRAGAPQAVAGHLGPKRFEICSSGIKDAAGVDHVPGRAFYGLRRVATDLAADFETDNRVLNRLTGHRDAETRQRIYQDREREETGARAAVTRRAMRKRLAENPESGE